MATGPASTIRAAIYVNDTHGEGGLRRQVGRLTKVLARRPGWTHVATYGDSGWAPAGARPGLAGLLAAAPFYVDVVVVDGCRRLAPSRRERDAIVEALGGYGVSVVVLRPQLGRRAARALAEVALADLIGEAAD
ncbi:MAG: recombinase family protein [Candidatus Dormibacteraceae bacterium]